MKNLIAMHQTFEKGQDNKGKSIIYVSDGDEHERLTLEKFEEFSQSLDPATVIRSTSVNATNILLLDLAERVRRIEYAFWHDTGLETGMDAEVITAQFAKLPAEIFRTFNPRPDLAHLKYVLSLRNALMEFAGDAMRRLKQAGRNAGMANEDEMDNEESFALALSQLKGLRKVQKIDELSPDKAVIKASETVPECLIFREVSGISSWIMAATFAAYSGGLDRFPSDKYFQFRSFSTSIGLT